MRILTASVEFTLHPAPGPLARVFLQLAQAMKRERAELTLLAPHCGEITADRRAPLARRLKGLTVTWQGRELELPLWETSINGGLRLLLVEHESFVRPALYGDGEGEWPDNAERFGLFGRAVAAAALLPGLRPEVVHLHDWPTGLVPYYLSRATGARPAVALSIYDLAFQGHYPAAVLEQLGIPAGDFTPDQLEYYGHLNFLKAGLRFADGIVAMGTDHVRTVLTPEGGRGMDGLLRHRGRALAGISPGIDVGELDPRRDPWLAQGYTAETIGGKRVCKRALQDEAGVPGRSDVPLIGFAPPLSSLLPPDQLRTVLEQVAGLGMQAVLLPGPADPELPAELLERFPEELGVLSPLEEGAYHRLLAGADLLVVPGQAEPFRQPRREALRYGTLPLVTGPGEPVASTEPSPGFEQTAPGAAGVLEALRRAARLYRDQKSWRLSMLEGMALDFSWQACAKEYLHFFSTLRAAGR